MRETLKSKLERIVNERVHGENFERLNSFLTGTSYTIKNDNQIYDENDIARGSFSLKFIEEGVVEILKLMPYGSNDEVALACE